MLVCDVERIMAEQSLVLGAGCFWCVEAQFRDIRGVTAVESGYAGGTTPNPTYNEVCSGDTGHAEVVRVTFDPEVISADDLLRLFFVAHDPTQKDRQGSDFGTQYRSVIFYNTEEERASAQRIIDEVNAEKIYSSPIVTTLEPLNAYTRAEEYHQDYYQKFEDANLLGKMGMNMGYCQAVVAPKVAQFRKKFRDKLKETANA